MCNLSCPHSPMDVYSPVVSVCSAQVQASLVIAGLLTLLQYDNILMEEAAQILEIETFIPLLLQVSSFLGPR